MNLAVHRGKVYRVGGMQPQNKAGEPEDTRSLADVARFDPATGKWESLPSLPTPRSSHDIVVVGDRLIVVGGWTMKGTAGKPVWPETMEVMDLAAPAPAWRSVPQPFKRRALVAAADSSKVYVIGGFDDRAKIVRGMSIYDVATESWSEGPALPGGPMNGFGAAAATVGGRLFVSIDDGGLYRLNDTATAWDKAGQATPRIVHRLAGDEKRIFVIGGALKDANSDLIEAIDVQR
jgi:N-acetylneuraminic acid mutarotase